MANKLEGVAHILHLNEKDLVGRTRLQKTGFFLEHLGVGFGFDYVYHHFGPFSEELAEATDDAIALGLVNQEWRTSKNLQSYAVFHSAGAHIEAGDNSDEKRRKILKILDSYDAIALELAATAAFLEKSGQYKDAWAETCSRKPSKSSAERIRKAKSLLDELKEL
ncbi:MAG: hypothetical protein KKH72_00790 [Alphaproteobacteria bacterium]|nr:hypothetical protein [Alphaproteobacteria bacterium]